MCRNMISSLNATLDLASWLSADGRLSVAPQKLVNSGAPMDARACPGFVIASVAP
jgi:hypothetical protein